MEKWTLQAIVKLKEHHIRQKDLAARLGYSTGYLSRILNGRERPRKAEHKIMSTIEDMITAAEQGVVV